MSDYMLVIGNKRFSSWSLRGWLAARMAGIAFQEVFVALRQEDTKEAIRKHSPSGKVPLLKTPDGPVWDSLAIAEYLADRFPEKELWPKERGARALARSVAAEMHSGFAPLRAEMPMDLGARFPGQGMTAQVEQDIARICDIWRDCRAAFGQSGPFLFGQACLADVAFAPVVTRFVTYEVPLDAVCAAYRDTIMSWGLMEDWAAAARAEG